MHRSYAFQVAVLATILCLSLAIVPAIAEAQTPAQQQQAQQEQQQQEQQQQEQTPPPGYEETIVVTASRTEQLLLDAPTAITVINNALIENAAALNYADLLRSVPGLNVSQTSARDINLTSRAATNTLATSQLVLVDGRTVYQDFFGFVAWDLLPINLDEVDRIEVIRGPGSAVWGANAMTGVVNVISKSPEDMGNIFNFRIGGGEQGTGYGSAIFSGVSNDWSYKVTGSYYTMDAWDRPETINNPLQTPANIYPNSGTKQPKFDARVDRQLEGNQWLSFSGGYAGTSGIIQTGIGPFDIQDDTRFWYVRGDYNRGSLNTRFYANILDGYGPNLLNGIDFFFETQTYDFSVQNTSVFADAAHILTYGGNFRFQGFDLSIAPVGDSRKEGGGFIEDSISAGEHLIFNLGARVDGFSVLDGPVLSPRLAMLFRPISGKDHVIRVSWNRAFRAPSLTNNYLFTVVPNQINLGAIPGVPDPTPYIFPSLAVGNSDLVEERLDQIEIGLRSITVNNKVSIDAAFYWTRTKDNIDFYTSEYYSPAEPPPGWPLPPFILALIPPLPKEFSYRNIGQIDNLGFEFGVNARPMPRNEFMANFTWQADPDVEGIPVIEVNKPPSFIFSIGWSGWYEDFLYSATVNYTGEAYWADVLDARFHGWTEAYTTLNATFGYSFMDNTLDLMVRGTNLTNQSVQQHVFGDIIGRRVVVELAYGWNY